MSSRVAWWILFGFSALGAPMGIAAVWFQLSHSTESSPVERICLAAHGLCGVTFVWALWKRRLFLSWDSRERWLLAGTVSVLCTGAYVMMGLFIFGGPKWDPHPRSRLTVKEMVDVMESASHLTAEDLTEVTGIEAIRFRNGYYGWKLKDGLLLAVTEEQNDGTLRIVRWLPTEH